MHLHVEATDAHAVSRGRRCTMSCEQGYPIPQVFLVDEGGGQHRSAQLPNLVPCWSFPPAQDRVRSRRKSHGCMGVSTSLAITVLLLFALVFAALGIGAYQIVNLQSELGDMRKRVAPVEEGSTAEGQIGSPEARLSGEDHRPAAHVTGRIEKSVFPKTLRWEPQTGRAFTAGGVAYRVEDGALQVNESGLYYIYSRVEFLFKHCSSQSSFIHSVFVRRLGHLSPLTLMEADRVGFCSQQQAHIWTTESYLGAALQLQQYDKVLVNVSHPVYLSHSHYANFFGLYKM